MRTTVLVLLSLLVAAPLAAEDEKDLVFRSFDVSPLTAPRSPSFASPLGAPPSRHLSPKIEREESEATLFVTSEALVEAIRESVSPESWERDGTDVSCRHGRLHARNRSAVLAEVDRFLAGLRAAAARRVLFHVEVVDRAAEKGGEVLASGSVEAVPGVAVALEVTRETRIVSDFDPEIASDVAISMPVIGTVREGLTAELVAHLTLDGKILVECLIEHGELEGAMRRLELAEEGDLNLGTVELPRFGHGGALATAVVPSGGSITLPFARDGRRFAVHVEARLTGVEGASRLVDIGVLTHSPLAYSLGYPPVEATSRDMVAPAVLPAGKGSPLVGTVDEVIELAREQEHPWYWEQEGDVADLGGGRLLVRASEEMTDRVRKFLRAREVEALRPVHLDVKAWSVAGGVKVGGGQAVDLGAAKLLYSGAVDCISGRRAFLRSGTTESYVAGYDVEVAEAARIADPTVGQCFSGLAANVVPRIDGGHVALDIWLLVARCELGEPAMTGAPFIGFLDKLTRRRTEIDTSVRVPANGVYTIDAGPDSAGRRIVVEVRASVE